MNDRTLLKVVATILVAPIVLGAVGTTINGAASLAKKISYNRKIKKGLKDGSIVSIDGVYYDVHIEDRA